MIFSKKNSWLLKAIEYPSNIERGPKYCYIMDVIDMNKGKFFMSDGKYFIFTTIDREGFRRGFEKYEIENIRMKGSFIIVNEYEFIEKKKGSIEMVVLDFLYCGEGSLEGDTMNINLFVENTIFKRRVLKVEEIDTIADERIKKYVRSVFSLSMAESSADVGDVPDTSVDNDRFLECAAYSPFSSLKEIECLFGENVFSLEDDANSTLLCTLDTDVDINSVIEEAVNDKRAESRDEKQKQKQKEKEKEKEIPSNQLIVEGVDGKRSMCVQIKKKQEGVVEGVTEKVAEKEVRKVVEREAQTVTQEVTHNQAQTVIQEVTQKVRHTVFARSLISNKVFFRSKGSNRSNVTSDNVPDDVDIILNNCSPVEDIKKCKIIIKTEDKERRVFRSLKFNIPVLRHKQAKEIMFEIGNNLFMKRISIENSEGSFMSEKKDLFVNEENRSSDSFIDSEYEGISYCKQKSH